MFRGMGKPQTYHAGDITEPAGCFVKSMLHFPPSNKKEQRSAENIAGCVVQPLVMLLQEVGNATNFSPGENILEKGFIQSW